MLPPPHPSLPRPPTNEPTTYAYPDPAYYSYGLHYAQAYYAYTPQPPPGVPNTVNKSDGIPIQLMSAWYQPGNSRCSYHGCTFQGSQKCVEIHKMDRHLIYPPGWEKRKKLEWDADPSLKGKPIPIQGTSVMLNTPELIDTWIAERKKRFPTSARVEEKKRKMEEAVGRGQLDLNPSKRRKFDRQPAKGQSRDFGCHGKSRPGKKPLVVRHDWRFAQNPKHTSTQNANPSVPAHPKSGNEDSDDNDAAPEEFPSKLPSLAESVDSVDIKPSLLMDSATHSVTPPEHRKPKQLQPRGPPKNPFASRPTLLRNLLLPEIRMTVSNLSQAIRFLVDNDFLRNVELKPGQVAERKIHVLSSQERSPS